MQKFKLNNEDDYIKWRKDMDGCAGYHLINDNNPEDYPCIVISCDGEDSGCWTVYIFVYLEDLKSETFSYSLSN